MHKSDLADKNGGQLAPLAHFPQPWVNVDATAHPQLLLQMMDAFNQTTWLKGHKARVLRNLVSLPHGSYLEVGCGTGEDAQRLACQLGSAGKVTGVDYSKTMMDEAMRRAAQRGLPLTFRRSDAYALPFADNTFDTSYSLLTFDILERPVDALKEMIRATKPGGTLLVSASDHGTLVIDAPDQRLTRTLTNFFCDNTCNGWIGRQLPAIFRNAGLANVSVMPDTVTLRSPDYAVARQVLLENMVRGAQTAAVVSKAQGDAWLAALDSAHQANVFFASSTFFIVAGQKAK
jgi:ubiquinone/menaquinone biosynthesis C-methylase UbiE